MGEFIAEAVDRVRPSFLFNDALLKILLLKKTEVPNMSCLLTINSPVKDLGFRIGQSGDLTKKISSPFLRWNSDKNM